MCHSPERGLPGHRSQPPEWRSFTEPPEDRALTTRIAEAGQLLGIALLDHVVIGNGRYFSFADHGPLTPHAPTYAS